MNEHIAVKRKMERERCNEAAGRTVAPLRVGYINAANYWGAPIPPNCALPQDLVHVSVPESGMRKQVKGVAFHVFQGKEEYYKREYERFWVASPAMMWAQMGRYCNVEELAAIGAALTSRDRRRKVTTLQELGKYVEASPKFTGRGKCLAALPYITENTDSPPETSLYGMLNDSGLGRPIANYRVDLDNGVYYLLDMAYPDCMVAFEYQGAYHADVGQMQADAVRINALQEKGWIIILVTAYDLRTPAARQDLIAVARTIVTRQRHLAAFYRSMVTANGSQ